MNPPVREPLRVAAEAAALLAALVLPWALRGTLMHVVPTVAGPWRGLTDPPGLASVVASVAFGVLAGALLLRRPPAVRRPLLALLLAGAPAVPLLTGALPGLLAFQGPLLVVVAAAAAAVALVRAGVLPGRAPRGAVLFGTALAFYALLGTRIPGPAGPQGDEPHYLTMAASLLRDGDLDLADEFADHEYRFFYAGKLEAHTSPASPPGRIYPVHTPGLAVLILPAFALGGYPGARLLISALAALTGVLVHRLVRDTLDSEPLGLAVWAAFTFTPPLAFYAVAIYPETPAALATAVFLLTARRDPGNGALFAAALAAAALPWLHPKLLPLAAIGLALTLARRGPLLARIFAGAGLVASVGLLLLFFHALYGRASLSAAYGPGFASDVSFARIPRGLAALLLDRQFGLLTIAPLFVLAAPGALGLWRARAGDAMRAALLAGATLAVGASFSMWWGGACPPARFVIPALPALALALAPAFRRHPGVAAALSGLGAAVVALAADAPRALHNRADGESGLLRFLAPAVDLDRLFPSFVSGGASALLLTLSLLAGLALAWAWGRRGLAVGAAAWLLVANGLAGRPWIDERLATGRLLEAWDGGNVLGLSGPLTLTELGLPLELRGAPWTVGPLDLRNSGRLDLPPGLYRVDVHGTGGDVPPHSKTTRLDVVAGELLLEREYVEEGRPGLSFPLLLPAGVRRLMLTAVGVQGTGWIEDVRLVPQALVPRRLREMFPWPREADESRYRVGSDAARVTALDRSQREGDSFRVQDESGAFLVEGPPNGRVRVTISRAHPAEGDALVWAGRSIPLRGPANLTLEASLEGGAVLGSTAVVPVELHSRAGAVAFAGISGE